ncbi:(3R)-hydroxymyristoyl-[acyl-carrier-protein] dehydratase [Serratia plymuthica]|nr:(3R)-hydroxymyristoyl-[acyl-carrier-protein] dehydratase [Serratia plymuthica]
MSYKNTHGAIIDAVSNGSFSMLFNSGCLFFEGHFPNNPVVPGVLLLDTIYDNLLKIGTPNITGIDNARFYNTVLPNEKVIVKINDLPDKVVCTVKNDTGKVLKVSYIKAQ